MYLATKGGSSCRIPERKADYYKSMGYSAWKTMEQKTERSKIHQERKEDQVKKNQLRRKT